MDEKISRTMNYYNGISSGYCELYHDEQKKKISLVKKHFSDSPITVLDLGSGDGVLNEFINKNCKLISFDLSIEFLNLNSNKFKVQGTATNLPFKSETFDLVISFTAIQDMEDFEKVIDEVKRALKPEGNFIVSFLKMSYKAEKISKKLEQEFRILNKVEEEKDFIYLLKRN